MRTQLNHVNVMGRNPDVCLLEARLECGLQLTHGLPVLRIVLSIDTNADKLIMVLRALIEPTSADSDRVRTGRPELVNQLVVGLHELLAFDGPTVVIEERE